MSLDPALLEQLRSMMNKAERSLKAGFQHVEQADYDFAASRAYYAAYYAMEAALLSREVTCSTHTGTIRSFCLCFVKSGILPVEYGTVAARLFRERQIGDYEFDVSISAPDAEEDLNAATSLVHAVDGYLKTL